MKFVTVTEEKSFAAVSDKQRLTPSLTVHTLARVLVGSARRGDDAHGDGARQVDLLPELPPGALLDALTGETHRVR